MSSPCQSPVSWETLVAHWADDLSESEADAVELHLMGCDFCVQEFQRVGAVTEAVRGLIPPIVTASMVEALRGRGLRVHENTFLPNDRREVVFREDLDLLVHRLAGLDLTQAERVSFVLRVEHSDRVLIALDSVPFDRETGSIRVACQKHYAHMPPDLVAEVRMRDAAGHASSATYTILHRYG